MFSPAHENHRTKELSSAQELYKISFIVFTPSAFSQIFGENPLSQDLQLA